MRPYGRRGWFNRDGQEDKGTPESPFQHTRTKPEGSCLQVGREASHQELDHVGTLAQQDCEKKILLFEPLHLWYVVLTARANQYTCCWWCHYWSAVLVHSRASPSSSFPTLPGPLLQMRTLHSQPCPRGLKLYMTSRGCQDARWRILRL
jgi:hypothetical protein